MYANRGVLVGRTWVISSFLCARERNRGFLRVTRPEANETVAPHVFKKNEIEAMMGSASKVKMPKEREQPKVGPVNP